MKRKLSFLLSLIMVFTFIPFISFAEENYDIQLKEAIIKSKKLFNIGSEYDKFTHSINSYDEDIQFNLEWSDSKGKLGNIYVGITIDGIVLNYDKWKPNLNNEGPKIATISKDEGLNIAKDFIKKVAPKFADNIKYIDTSEPINIYHDQYHYYFVRTQNGIPYYNNNINVNVDTSTGEVKNYYSNWERNLVFPDAKSTVTLEKVQELYKEKIGLDLLYKSNYIYRLDYNDKKQETYLVYAPMNTNVGINAKTGDIVTLNDYSRMYDTNGEMNAKNNAAAEELSPDEKQAVEDISGLISKKEAENISREILKLDSNYKLQSSNLYKNWRSNDYNWQFSFEKKMDSDRYYYANISIDAKTKELISFNKSIPDLQDKTQYNEEKALNIVKEYIKKTNPDKFELIELRKNLGDSETSQNNNYYYFNFIRKLDSAYVESEGISVSITNGEITAYNINWSNCEFAPQTNIMPIEKAYDILFNDVGIELKYINPYRYVGDSDKNKEAILVYGLKSIKPANIDANTGTILDYTGEPFKEKTIISYDDIDKSYAKDKINTLAKHGIVLPGEQFKPNEKINQKDFLSLLVKSIEPYFELDNPRNDLYNYLINIGILKEKEKSPEKIVTKEEGIKYIIRALKYDKIADLSNIYKDLFKDTKDINPELKGYVSIAYGLGIVEGNDGKLNPKVELKREDAANMIYNYLFGGK